MNYLLVDSAIVGDYPIFLLKEKFPHISLFSKTTDQKLENVAPYLFEVKNLSAAYNFKEVESVTPTFIVIEATCSLNELLIHFKKFIYQKINGQEYYYRFWDYRVLRKTLFNYEITKLKEFFGPIESFLVNDEDSKFKIILTLNLNDKLSKKIISNQEFENSFEEEMPMDSTIEDKPTITPYKKVKQVEDLKKEKKDGNKGKFSILD